MSSPALSDLMLSTSRLARSVLGMESCLSTERATARKSAKKRFTVMSSSSRDRSR